MRVRQPFREEQEEQFSITIADYGNREKEFLLK
jgi:hypothetical protein